MNRAVMDAYGIDYKKGIERCLGDEALYEEILAMFLADDAFSRARGAYERRDCGALFKSVHELKGTTGNVSLTELYGAVCALVEYLRRGGDAAGEVDALFAAMAAAYERTREGITLALAD